MSVKLDELAVQLIAEVTEYNANMAAAISSTEKATEKMTDAVDSFSKDSEKSLSFFDQAMATTVGFLASNVVLGAFDKLKESAKFAFGELNDGINSAAATEVAFQRLANSLALNGTYTTQSMMALQEYSKVLQDTVGIDDTLTAANLSLLSSLTKLDAQGLQRAHKAAVELSATGLMSLESATMLVAKGVTNSTDVFKKYGIQIEDGFNRTQRLANITGALAGLQGTAEGTTNTYEGSIKLLNLAYEDLLKGIGNFLVQNPVVIAMLQATTKEIRTLGGAAEDSEAPITALALSLLTITEFTRDVLIAVDAVYRAFKLVWITAEGIAAVFYQVIAAGDALTRMFMNMEQSSEAFARSNAHWAKFSKDLEENRSYALGLIDTLDNVADAGAGAFDSVSGGARVATPAVQGVTAAVKELSDMQLLYNQNVESFSQALVQQSISSQAYYATELEMLNLSLASKIVSYDTYWATREAQLLSQYGQEQYMLDTALANKKISEEAYNAAALQLRRNNNLEEAKLNKEKADKEKKDRDALLSQTGNLFGALAMLQESGSKEMVAIGKAAAIAQATLNMYVGITRAWADLPYPAAVVATAAIGIQGALTIAKISGVGFKDGIDRVPGNASGDRFPAMLEGGERVTSKRTNKDLTKFLDEQNNGTGRAQEMNLNFNFTGATFVGPLNGAEFGAMVSEAIEEAKARGMVAGVA